MMVEMMMVVKCVTELIAEDNWKTHYASKHPKFDDFAKCDGPTDGQTHRIKEMQLFTV